MAHIKPFRALRPGPLKAAKICELPYDVMSSEEARVIAGDNHLSFLHVSKPEIDLAPDVDVHSDEVYAKGRENFDRLIADKHLLQDEAPCFYLYRLVMGKHTQIGLVAVASCEDYQKDIVKKHELTRPDKEDDRVRHIESLNSQTGPVFLTYPAQPELDTLFETIGETEPEVDFTAKDGVRHSAWVIRNEDTIAKIVEDFGALPSLYIADGHHRSAAAARVFEARKGAGSSGWFLAVIFPHDQMQILPYNRAVKDLNGQTPEAFLAKLLELFEVVREGEAKPTAKNQIGLYLGGMWRLLRFRPEIAQVANPLDGLDVALLQKHVLSPLLGIDDPRTSKRIAFVGGIRGTGELEKLVNSGEFACAFSMFPTSIVDLMDISDQGGLMPPKSTWFEPKLRDGMFSHLLD